MDEWIEKQFKKYNPMYEACISNFNEFGHKRLVALREATDPQNRNFNSKLSQRNLSSLADMPPQNYNKLEKGRNNGGNNFTLKHAIKLASFMVVPLTTLCLVMYRINASQRKT